MYVKINVRISVSECAEKISVTAVGASGITTRQIFRNISEHYYIIFVRLQITTIKQGGAISIVLSHLTEFATDVR